MPFAFTIFNQGDLEGLPSAEQTAGLFWLVLTLQYLKLLSPLITAVLANKKKYLPCPLLLRPTGLAWPRPHY